MIMNPMCSWFVPQTTSRNCRRSSVEARDSTACSYALQAYDLIIVGDGSYQHVSSRANLGWEGWSAVIIDTATKTRKVCFGGGTGVSATHAELMAYWHALSWYDDSNPRRVVDNKLLKAAILTDNRSLLDIAKTAREDLSSVHLCKCLWAGILCLENSGIEITWKWIRRSKLLLNCYCDLIATLSRKQISQIQAKDPSCGSVIDVYDIEPYM
jgi:ribonuclease HI